MLTDFTNKICTPVDDSSVSVINLSDYSLNCDELSLLERGLNFCPTPGEPHMGDLRRDLDNFHRRLKIKAFFDPANARLNPAAPVLSPASDSESSDGEDDPTPSNDNPILSAINRSKVIKNENPWQPSIVPVPLKAYILTNETDLNKTFVKSPHSQNISRAEKQALKSLSNNSDIIIKKADKGSSIVIQNKVDYIKEGERQLSDPKFYKEVPEDLTENSNVEITEYLDKLHDLGKLSKSLNKKLKTLKPRTANLYLLPKIHKGIRPPPGRPIVSANGCPTEKISALVDIILRPYLTKTKSYLRDTTQFLNKLENLGTLSVDCILGTLDVASLYTNIPNDEGCFSIYKLLNKERHPSVTELSNSSICRLLWLVLTKNNFDFNGKHYLQVGGTAMGTRLAPTYANLFMAHFEDKFVYTYEKQPLIWIRFIDDIFYIWPHGQFELDKFIKHLNSIHKTIKFTSESSLTNVNFLDTVVHLNDDNTLTTSLYVKPTDSASYLHYNSAHPRHCIREIPYGQFLRIRRICSNEQDFIDHCITKGRHFIRRGYPAPFIANAFYKALQISRSTLLEPKNGGDKPIIPNIIVTTYTPGFNGLQKVVNDNWDILGKSCTTRSIHKTPLITAFRRPKNLKDYLVRAKLKQTRDNTSENPNICLRPNTCRYCPKLNTDGRILCSASGRTYMSRFNVSCSSSNLIYCITCKRCGIQYVGQTKRELKMRLSEHFLKITKNDPDSEIASHYNSTHHSGLDDIMIHVIDFVHAAPHTQRSKYLRDLIEFNWIQRLHSNAPTGLNVMDLLRS